MGINTFHICKEVAGTVTHTLQPIAYPYQL